MREEHISYLRQRARNDFTVRLGYNFDVLKFTLAVKVNDSAQGDYIMYLDNKEALSLAREPEEAFSTRAWIMVLEDALGKTLLEKEKYDN